MSVIVKLTHQDYAQLKHRARSWIKHDPTGKKALKGYSENTCDTGCAGELAYSKWSGLPVDNKLYAVGDNGIDFQKNREVIQIKTATFKSDRYPTELKASKNIIEKSKCTKLVLCHYNEKVNPFQVEIIGEISKDNYIKKCRHKQGVNKLGKPFSYDYVTEHDLDTLFS
jgi:hypothetical protein